MTDHQYGPKSRIVDAFTAHLKAMTERDWNGITRLTNTTSQYAWDAAKLAAWNAAWEIQGSDLLRERNPPFFFLPLFGFADEQAVLATLQPEEGK